MKLLIALVGMAIGFVMCVILYILLFYVWREAGCFRWDPGSTWTPPSNCAALATTNKVTMTIALLIAVGAPIYIAIRRQR